jgi:hypothetical protein
MDSALRFLFGISPAGRGEKMGEKIVIAGLRPQHAMAMALAVHDFCSNVTVGFFQLRAPLV